MFVKPKARYFSAYSFHTDCIKNWVTTFCDHIDNFIRPNHMNTYSNRKVGATYDSSVTTDPPPLSSIFYCGGWTIGIVLDIHWKFAEACYNYIGRPYSLYSSI